MEVVGEGERRVGRAVVRCEDIDSEEDSGFMNGEEEFERMVRRVRRGSATRRGRWSKRRRPRWRKR